jgi:hypothetical protein
MKTVVCRDCTVKKGWRFSRSQPGYHYPNSPWPGIIKLFLDRESLVRDILAGVGTGKKKSLTFFYSVVSIHIDKLS